MDDDSTPSQHATKPTRHKGAVRGSQPNPRGIDWVNKGEDHHKGADTYGQADKDGGLNRQQEVAFQTEDSPVSG